MLITPEDDWNSIKSGSKRGETCLDKEGEAAAEARYIHSTYVYLSTYMLLRIYLIVTYDELTCVCLLLRTWIGAYTLLEIACKTDETQGKGTDSLRFGWYCCGFTWYLHWKRCNNCIQWGFEGISGFGSKAWSKWPTEKSADKPNRRRKGCSSFKAPKKAGVVSAHDDRVSLRSNFL